MCVRNVLVFWSLGFELCVPDVLVCRRLGCYLCMPDLPVCWRLGLNFVCLMYLCVWEVRL
jgi:hypothetical protein